MIDHDGIQNFLNSPLGVQSVQRAANLRSASKIEDVHRILVLDLGHLSIDTEGLILQLLASIDDLESEVDELRGRLREDGLWPYPEEDTDVESVSS